MRIGFLGYSTHTITMIRTPQTQGSTGNYLVLYIIIIMIISTTIIIVVIVICAPCGPILLKAARSLPSDETSGNSAWEI